jgi:hypothetical protein
VPDERDEWIRATLERARVPDESPTFFDELWETAQARERAAARRWRRVSLALAVAAVIAISSAAVLAASSPSRGTTGVVDVRGVCAATQMGGITVFSVGARPSNRPTSPSQINVKPPPGFHVDPSLWLQNGDPMYGAIVFSLTPFYSGYQLDRRSCTPTGLAIRLSRSGLSDASRVHLTEPSTQLVKRCLGVGRFAFRVRIVSDKTGVPVSAQLAVVRARTGKPLAYDRWTASRVDGWSAPSCE